MVHNSVSPVLTLTLSVPFVVFFSILFELIFNACINHFWGRSMTRFSLLLLILSKKFTLFFFPFPFFQFSILSLYFTHLCYIGLVSTRQKSFPFKHPDNVLESKGNVCVFV